MKLLFKRIIVESRKVSLKGYRKKMRTWRSKMTTSCF